MSALRQRMIDAMVLRGLAARTQEGQGALLCPMCHALFVCVQKGNVTPRRVEKQPRSDASVHAVVLIHTHVTDFHYACYLSDLAVHRDYQRSGIGKRLQSLTQEQLGPRCKLILIAAPAANLYYAQIGYTHNDRCWVLDRATPVNN
ncbi:MAG TPA: GNAT family N-acetyltransferase [Rhodocyclaceae bacterium]|jgi:GNAT superfamily N-acetyltransferase|nr:GNAT family N-acetyltransferase [Rhodocyclaceae bacterium]HRQ47283.1 GNAT family N-acetyltransferase [Rhodocyclaceae bacterium]